MSGAGAARTLPPEWRSWAAEEPPEDPRGTLILSDLHLGRGPCTAERLAPLLADAGTVVLNGDSAEILLPSARDAARRELDALRTRMTREGTRAVFLEGNHDLGISNARHAFLAGGRILVTHGDAFDPRVAPWTPWAREAATAAAEAMERLPESARMTIDARFSAARAAAECEWSDPARAEQHGGVMALLRRPHAVALILAYWRRYPRLAAEFAAAFAPGAMAVVCGHSHRPGSWKVGDRWILNTGHFEFPARPFAVRVRNGAMAMERIRLGKRGYEFASTVAAWTSRAAAAAAEASTPVWIPQPLSR